MKVYRGLRVATGATIVGLDDGGVLVHDEEDPPFTWGESGSGAMALARSLLIDHLGFRPARGVVHAFATRTVATWTSNRWLLTTSEIDDALIHVRSALQVSCLQCGDTGRRERAPRLWGTCECSRPPTIDPDA